MALVALLTILVQPAQTPPLRTGIGNYHRQASSVKLAQSYFDQALALDYAFHKTESQRCFAEAARLDPGSAMAWWGMAVSRGPDINNPMVSPEMSVEALDALDKGEKVAKTPLETDLTRVQKLRFDRSGPADRSKLDAAYSKAMGELATKYPKDPDVLALYGESLMILSPWSQWDENGKPNPGTMEAIAVIKKALALSPEHLLANHLYIHVTEAGPNPGEALTSADKLCKLAPALGHLVHMPSHTYVRVGKWAEAQHQNELALEGDYKFFKKNEVPVTYVGYIAHNQMMLGYAACMRGDYDAAAKAMSQFRESLTPEVLKEYGDFIDGWSAMPLEVERRFGHWDAILAEPIYPEFLPVSSAMQRGARAIAYAATGEMDKAHEELALEKKFEAMVKDGSHSGLNTGKAIATLEGHVSAGEVFALEGKYDEAIAELKSAVEIEDKLQYDEPPDWLLPSRHTLGAILLKAGRYKEAIDVYQADLKKTPHNGWSLIGISKAYHQLEMLKESADFDKQFQAVWAKNGPKISSSCLCLPGG